MLKDKRSIQEYAHLTPTSGLDLGLNAAVSIHSGFCGWQLISVSGLIQGFWGADQPFRAAVFVACASLGHGFRVQDIITIIAQLQSTFMGLV